MKKLHFFMCAICAMPFTILFAQNPSKVSPFFHDELIQAQNKLTPQYSEVLDKTYEAMLSNQRLLTRDISLCVFDF